MTLSKIFSGCCPAVPPVTQEKSIQQRLLSRPIPQYSYFTNTASPIPAVNSKFIRDVRGGSYNAVKTQIERFSGSDINSVVDANRNSALMWACVSANRDQHSQNPELLLKAQANPNYQNPRGETALMWAAKNGFLDYVKVLMRYNADPTFQDNEGRTALDIAAQNYQQGVVDFFEEISSRSHYS